MPIPAFLASGVLPPYLGDPTERFSRSPHAATSLEVVTRFATSRKRCTLLDGWLRYRQELHALGARGFQWIDGSFCEDLAREVPPREPGDIDCVSFYEPAAGLTLQDITNRINARIDLRPRGQAKATYHCDVYYVRLLPPPPVVPPPAVPIAPVPVARVDDVHYWYGLFSHRRGDAAWKGILQIPLPVAATDDVAAANALNNVTTLLTQVAQP